MHQCKEMNKAIFINNSDSDNEDKMVKYYKRFNEYGFPILDGENSDVISTIGIKFCPWCGKKLPESQRDAYFNILETLDIYNIHDKNIPDELKRDDWWDNKEGK
ncbi:DUF6980 family protein [Lactococcus carnosus]|uniref:DUF6980 domain-containing protein n=1 Tax=Pseudolactococcus carnosus TaxID=2749961 RepID=A0ABT0AQT4_9LACT|nr:hypothetical protein [Lactococcus carnosus]MCJ1989079.1 hypothetical protein [Lactococcus carnosus]SCA91935.1 conserved hypothetical protein [Lactococcus piscium]